MAAALEVVWDSPRRVADRDKDGWLALFTDDAAVEDPVGGPTHRGQARLSAFWDVFIAPQRAIRFVPITDFVAEGLVVRRVTIETWTAVAPDPLRVEAVVEYRVRDGKISVLRAIWNVWGPVRWHASRGRSGWVGLALHGARLVSRLGLGGGVRFGRGMLPAVSTRAARAWADDLAQGGSAWEASAGPPEHWHACAGATVEEVHRAGRRVAAILATASGPAVALGRLDGRRIVGTGVAFSPGSSAAPRRSVEP